jgi:transposase-like protein
MEKVHWSLKLKLESEEECISYLMKLKWPDGFSCPRCSYSQAYVTSTRRLPIYECRSCHHQTTITAGTIFEGSRTKLTKWFTALTLVSQDQGCSATRLSEVIQVTYKTAWLILRKIRYALGESDKITLLTGEIQVNAAIYGRPHNPTIHNHPSEHPLLVGSGIASNNENELPYLKIKTISKNHMKQKYILPQANLTFMQKQIHPSSAKGAVFVTARFSFQRFHHLLEQAALASRWLNNTFKGIGRKHLQAYLDEFCYRQNYSQQSASLLFYLTQSCLSATKITYATLINSA